MSKFFKIKKAEQTEDQVLAPLGNAISDAIDYYSNKLETTNNSEDKNFYQNCINLLKSIEPTIKNNEFWKFDGAIEVQAKLKKKVEI